MADWRDNVKPGWIFTLLINQGDRDAVVLAVRGRQALAEYEMPNGSTALAILDLPEDETREPGRQSVSYRGLSTPWLRAIVEAESTWIGKPQQTGSWRPASPEAMLAERTALLKA